MVWRLLRRKGIRNSDAEDAAQDVFWIFSQHADKIPVGAERAYLAATALRVASERRRSKWYKNESVVYDDAQHRTIQAAPDNQLEQARRLEVLDRALTLLDSKERDVFILTELEELSKAEVALALSIPEGTVASRLRRARQSFADAVARLRRDEGLLL